MKNSYEVQSLVKKLTKNPSLLKEKGYQKFVKNLVLALDQGKISVVKDFEGHLKVDQWVIELLSLAIAVRKENLQLFPDSKSLKSLDKSIRWVSRTPVVRFGAYIHKKVILMPHSFVNIGASVGEGTMVDVGVRIGSGAYIGKRCHISGGVGIGGVLEPQEILPVIIEDDCLVGANSTISEGVRIGKGSIIGAGTVLTGSTRIYDSRNRERIRIKDGCIPKGVLVISSFYLDSGMSLSRRCVEIVKDVTLQHSSKAHNKILRK